MTTTSTPAKKSAGSTKKAAPKAEAPAKEKKPQVPLSERGDYPPPPQVIFFTVDGRRIGVTQHTLSYLAGYSGRGEQRLSVSAFIERVVKATKVPAEELLSRPWSYTLRCASGDGHRDRLIEAKVVPGRKAAKPETTRTPRKAAASKKAA
jgi:hypothetical protein